MALTTFPAIDPSVGTSKKTNYNIKIAQFGDGFSQRSARGINNVVDVWSLTFTNVNNTDADTLEAFVVARGGTEAFLWTPPFEATEKQWTITPGSFQRTPNIVNSSTVTMELVENFDL
jgi:phage-related protein